MRIAWPSGVSMLEPQSSSYLSSKLCVRTMVYYTLLILKAIASGPSAFFNRRFVQ